MRIAIDISQIVYGTGVSIYTRNLVENLLEIDKDNEYILFAGSLRRTRDVISIFPGTKVFPIPPVATDFIWNKLHILPIEKLIGQVDVLHTSDWSEPPSFAVKVTTVHDLAPFLYPNLFPRDSLRDIIRTHKSKLSWVKQESKRIIVPTNSTKEDLIKLGFSRGRINVVPEAVSDIFAPKDKLAVDAVKSKYRLHGRYFLSVGLDPRKNTDRIIKAFEHASAGKDVKLLLVGHPKYIKINETRNVRLLTGVSNDELPALYSGAVALVYPSLYEGFGLPILEAMACGCPVITSGISSTAEVAGEAAYLVDPYNTDSIEEAMIKMLRGGKSFIANGINRAKDFSWKKTAQETLSVYYNAVRN